MNRAYAPWITALAILALTLVVAAVAQDDPAANLTAAYTSLQEEVKGENWEGVATEAHAMIAAGAAIAPDELTAQQHYLIGMAHYFLMGIAMNAVTDGPGLTVDEVEFAQKLADDVYGREAPSKIVTVAYGDEITLADHLFAGKTTIVDFYSEYCPPCVSIGPVLEKLVEGREDLAIVKVDINRPGRQGIDWESPAAQQFKLRSIPHFQIYGPDGGLVAEGDQAVQMLIGWTQGGQ
jgi:thiol-disulfide isomerase/thioredoxin